MALNGNILYAFYTTLQIKCSHEHIQEKKKKEKKTVNRETQSLKLEFSSRSLNNSMCLFNKEIEKAGNFSAQPSAAV